MSDESIGGNSPHHAHAEEKTNFSIPLEAPIQFNPIKVKIEKGDSIESVGGKTTTQKGKRADSPALTQSEWMLWYAATTNSYTLQSTGGGAGSLIDIDVISRSPNPELVALKQKNALLAIGVKVLNAWTENLRNEARQIRHELNSDRHRHFLEARGKAGFEAYLKTLTPEQREHAIHHSRLEKLAKIDEGLAQGIGDYLTRIKTHPTEQTDIQFMGGVLSAGSSVRSDPSSALVNPVGSVSETVLHVMPNYSVEMATLATMFGVATVYFTMGQTVSSGVVPTDTVFTHKFAENYAEKVLKTVNGSEFNSLAMAIVTAQSTENEPLTEERKTQLINVIKVVMLSSALILLYKTESSFKGLGGGITEIEFADLVYGTGVGKDRTDLAGKLGGIIHGLLETIPDSDVLMAGIEDYIFTNPKTASLVDIDSVFSGVGRQIKPRELQG